MTECGKLVQVARADQGIPVRALARLILKPDGSAIAPSYITDIEKGRGIPRDHIARQIETALNIRAGQLVAACRTDREARRGS
jgi:ribosome-binding protein aMBF1 (putative translation factor)